jgi:polar amino acid transport system substrate-binding protein
MKRYILFILLLVFSGMGTAATIPDNLTILTEQYPPLNYVEDGVLKGISADLVVAAMQDLDPAFNRSSIRVLPWTEAYNMALNQPDTLLFSTARLAKREDSFLWAGHLYDDPKVLFGLDSRRIGKAEVEALRIAVITNDSSEEYVLAAGANPSRLVHVITAEEAIKALESGSADLFAYGEVAGTKAIEQYAKPSSGYGVVYSLGECSDYVAANRNTSPEFIEALNQSLHGLRLERAETGVTPYEQILGKYLPVQCVRDSASPEQVTTLVGKTAQDLHKNLTATVAAVNAGVPPYQDTKNPDLYVFVFDMNTTVIANPGNPDLVGKNMQGKGDLNGKKFRDELIAKAKKEGSGWVSYIYSSPSMNGIYKKEAFGMIITGSDGNQYVVGGGRLLPCTGE